MNYNCNFSKHIYSLLLLPWSYKLSYFSVRYQLISCFWFTWFVFNERFLPNKALVIYQNSFYGKPKVYIFKNACTYNQSISSSKNISLFPFWRRCGYIHSQCKFQPHIFWYTGPVHNMFRSEWKCFGFAWKCLNFPTTPGRFLPGMISVK